MTMIVRDTIKIVPVADLVPTQMTVGMREVNFKRERWRKRSSREAANYLDEIRIPVVLGPNARHYLIDRHHITRALHHEGICELTVSLVANLSALSFDEFWTILERQHWAHPFDDEGRRRCYNEMPETIENLQDDPFRSLAGAVKRAGGFAKDEAPFSEFRWADFLRCRISRGLVERDFGRALAMAMHLARGPEATALSGWRHLTTAEEKSNWPSDHRRMGQLADDLNPQRRTAGRCVRVMVTPVVVAELTSEGIPH